MAQSSFKIVIVGESRVGKTSITQRYVKNNFLENQSPTIDVSFCSKYIMYKGKMQILNIWVFLRKDTAGEEKYHSISSFYYKNSNGAIIVYDITDEKSFNTLQSWVEELKKELPEIPIILVGNKCDLESFRRISKEEVDKYR